MDGVTRPVCAIVHEGNRSVTPAAYARKKDNDGDKQVTL